MNKQFDFKKVDETRVEVTLTQQLVEVKTYDLDHLKKALLAKKAQRLTDSQSFEKALAKLDADIADLEHMIEQSEAIGVKTKQKE